MIRNFLLSCAACWLGAILFYGFRHHEPRADFRYVNPSGIHTLDPARVSWTQDFRVALNIWEPLFTWDARSLEVRPAAAAGPFEVAAGGLVHVVKLRADGRWSNGDPVRAQDFVRAWRRAIEPGTAADYSFLVTERVAGAADYVAFRNEAVAALTALHRLADGWGITSGQACDLTRHGLFTAIREAGVACSPPAVESPDACEAARRCLDAAGADWKSWHERLLRAHFDRMETAIRSVGVTAEEDHTLTVRLTSPCPYFADLLALPVFLPVHESIDRLRVAHAGVPLSAEGLVLYDPQWTKPEFHANGYPGLLTNGPYRVASWVFKQRTRLTVNPYHRDADRIACRTVDMLVFDNISAAIMAYEAGDVDFLPAMDVPYDHEIARLARSGQRRDFRLCHVAATYFLNFNCVSERVRGIPNPFVDARVRKAFALAAARADVVDRVLQRGDRVANSFVPPGSMPGYDPPEGVTQNASAAREWLAEAGFPDGRGFPPVDFLYLPSDERVAQALARHWADTLNVRFELRSMESKTFAEEKAGQRFMLARGNWYADYNDPTTFLNCLRTGNGNNDSGFSSERYDALLMEADRTLDAARRMALLARAEGLMLRDDVPILPILHYAAPIAIKPYVDGLHPNARLWFPFREVSVRR